MKLDDILSELDKKRREFLVSHIKGKQIIITCTDIEEGFEAIQEAVNAASDLEQEKIQQRLNWISVCGNLGPSLGLLGTVQGMILTFQALASGGAGDAAAL